MLPIVAACRFRGRHFRRWLLRNRGLTGAFPSDNLIPSPFRTLSIMSSITLLLRVRAKAWAGRAAIVLGELSSLRPSAGIRRTISTAGIEMVSGKSRSTVAQGERSGQDGCLVVYFCCRGFLLAREPDGQPRGPKSSNCSQGLSGAGQGVTSSGRRRRMRVSAR